MSNAHYRKIWVADIAFHEGRRVGCFCPDMTLYYLREEFGDDLECDGIDKMIGFGDRRAQSADTLGIPRDSSVILCAYRLEKELRPRYDFIIRMEQASVINGHVNRGGIRFEWDGECELPEGVGARIESFLDSIRFGHLSISRS